METVVSCNPSGRVWNDKTIYSVGLSDGRGGESFSQLAVGTPVSELEITTDPKWGIKIKKKSTGGQGGNFQKRGGNESFAMSYSKDIVCAGKTDLKNLMPLADKIYAWLEGKKASAPTQSAASLEPKQEQWKLQGTVADNSDSLPF